MKWLCVFPALLFYALGGLAQGFSVDHFNAEFILNKDGYFDVIERYDINFTESKHGIIRNIITKYDLQTTGGRTASRTIYISDVQVPGYTFNVTPKYEQQLNGRLDIKIGDKDKLISGRHQYEIRYRVRNAFIANDSIVQFYWNIKPPDWQATFHRIQFTVQVPHEIPLQADNCFIYAGPSGTAHLSNDFITDYAPGKLSAQSKPGINFDYGESVTVLIRMPAKSIVVTEYSPSFFRQWGWAAILLVIVALFLVVWNKWGRDSKVISVTSYYPPKGIDPAMAGYLMNDMADATDLVALIPKWGAEGVIQVEEIPKKGWFGKADTRLIKLKDLLLHVPAYEQKIFDGLFANSDMAKASKGEGDMSVSENKGAVLVSELKDKFYKVMNDAKKELKRDARQFYDPHSRLVMQVAFVVLILLGISLGVLFLNIFGILAAICSAVVFLVLVLSSFFLQRKNQKGNEALSELKGFRNFVKLAELNRIQSLLQEDPRYFEKTMSYALAFGLLKEWAAKFDALEIQPPGWYTGTTYGYGGMNRFAGSFGDSMSTMRSAMVSAPSGGAGGGGSSGGGFGGGGGSSW